MLIDSIGEELDTGVTGANGNLVLARVDGRIDGELQQSDHLFILI